MTKQLKYLILLLVATIAVACDGPEKAKTDQPSTQSVSYSGSENCMSCHEQEYNDWETSHHAKAMQHASDSTILGDFNNKTVELGGGKSTFFKKGDDYFINAESGTGEHTDFKVLYAFGVFPLQQYLVELDGGRLQAFRLAWDDVEKEWYDLYPDQDIIPQDWLHWTRGGLNWNTMCAECHSTNVEKNYSPKNFSYNTTFDLINVSCESCHGAGEEHVKWAKNAPSTEDKETYIKLTVNQEEQIRSCAPCHSRKGNINSKLSFSGNMLDSFIPEILIDGLYHADGQINDEVYVYGSFIQSKMYQNGVKCSDCHNSHSLELKQEGNNLCMQCHEPKYNTKKHTFHDMDSEAGKCINCHMTGKYYMGVDFRRDHSFRVPRPDQSAEFGTPNACTQCHEDKPSQWAAEKVVEWYGEKRARHFSDALTVGRLREASSIEPLGKLLEDFTQPDIARATAAYYLADIPTADSYEYLIQNLNDSSALVRHYILSSLINLPENQRINLAAPFLKDSIKGVRVEAAEVLADIGEKNIPEAYVADYLKAIREYEQMLTNRLDFPMGRFMAGQYEFRKGNTEKAIQRYVEAVQMDTLLHIARENMARIYNQQGKNDLAEKVLKTTITLDSGNAQAYYSLGLLRAEQNDLRGSAKYLKKAIQFDPYNERAHYNLGLALQHLQMTAEAEKVYLNALDILPYSTNIRQALAILYLQSNDKMRAKPYIEYLKERFPEDPNILQLQNALGN